MSQTRRVVLFGDSLILEGVRASLAACTSIEVTGLDGPTASEQELCALQPDVIIFDIGGVKPPFQYELVEDLPDLLLVGIDASSNRVLTWSGQQLSDLSTSDFVDVIKHQDKGGHQ